ncbi:MAG TPA: riboflavin biosynthesis protein RibF [Candidatus Aminicenantes bacterium]|nr:riboflavin biosynthesis protein RibF [Candidatus Aminicenantes bacterium]
MIVYHGVDDPLLLPRPSAVAVGNFDGLHLGHRKILRRLRRLAEAAGVRSLVLTFSPHPERALGRTSVRMIDTPEARLDRFRETGVDAVVVTAFDPAFARLGCREFVDGVLRARLGAREIVVGAGFRFGRGRRGGTARLEELGRAAGLRVHVVPPARLDGRVVSSTAVRRLLEAGRVDQAARLLGRPYEVRGRVVGGDRRGRRLGFPTANLETASEILPRGVFITEAARGRRVYPSLTSIGTNPTFGPHPLAVETLLLGFRGSLYGAELAVRFLRKLRPTRTFRSAAALAARIREDREAARAWFSRRH